MHECGAHSGEQEREVEVVNEVGAAVGDRIQLSIATGSLMKATFLLYLFPVLCMLAGGIAGQAIATRRHWDPSLFSVIAALVCLAISILAVRFGGNRMARKAAYQPRIIRILARNPHDSDASPC